MFGHVFVRMRCLTDDLSSDTLSTSCTHSRHPHRRSPRSYFLRPSMDYSHSAEPFPRRDNHIGPLLRTPRHPSEANRGGEPGPLASGLGRRHAFHCLVVGRRANYSARPPQCPRSRELPEYYLGGAGASQSWSSPVAALPATGDDSHDDHDDHKLTAAELAAFCR